MGAEGHDVRRVQGEQVDAAITTRGRTRLTIAGEPVALRPRERSVLAAIAASHPRPADLDDVIDRVWGSSAPQHARNSLHNHIGRIRRTAPGIVKTIDDGYALDDAVVVDHVDGDAGDTPLGDLADTEDVRDLRARIDGQSEAALEAQVRAALAHPTPESLATARQLTDAHPDREHLWHLLAATQSALGHRRDALTSIRSARRSLADYGLELGTELKAFEAELLAGVSTTPHTGQRSHARIHPHGDDPFVSRHTELHDLAATWAAVVERRSPRLAIVRGPAGIGKTRLVDEFVRSATATATPAPTVIVSRERVDDDRPLGALTDVVGASPAATIVAPTDSDVGIELQRRVDAAVASIASTPTIWCIDDLQWTPTDSLRLLTHAIEAASGPLLLVTTHRSGELSTPGLLDRRVDTTVVELAPMERDEVEDLITAWAVPATASDDLDLLHRRTAGLPMFASEIARVASRRGERIDAASIPTALTDWVRNRLEEFDDLTTQVIQTAAAIGREFDADLVAASTGVDVDVVDTVLDDLVTRGVVAGTDRPGELRFAHVVVRDVVYDMLGPARARRRHASIAASIAADPDSMHPTEWHASLALHLHRGGRSGDEVRRHAIAAGTAQLSDGAWSAAHQSIRLALDTDPPDAERAELLAMRGRAELRLQQFTEATASLHATIDIATRLGLVELQGRATLDLAGRAGRGADTEASDEERIALVRSALDALGPDHDDSPDLAELRSGLERELAFALLLTGDADERARLLAASVERIERLDPVRPRALALALLGNRYAQLAPQHLEQRLADIDRVLSFDESEVGVETVIAAHIYRAEEELRAGRARRTVASLDAADRALRGHHDPYLTWAASGWRVLVAVYDGDIEQAERLAVETMAIGGESGGAVAALGVNLTNIRLLQHRADEMIDLIAAAVDSHPEIPAYRAVLALCAAESGDDALAMSSIDWFTATEFGNLPHDTTRSLALATLAHAAAIIGHRDAATALAPMLEPYAGQHIVISTYGGGGAYWGPASHALGRLAGLLGDAVGARRWFARAADEAADAPAFLERIRHDASAMAQAATAS
jgi:tetratricopeptide (TPR) repeat protein